MNICFEYLYRDGANYKSWGEVVLKATSDLDLAEIETRLRGVLVDGQNFIAEEANIPTLYFDTRDITVDHGWHEYSGLSWTDKAATTSDSIEELIKHLSGRKERQNQRRI